MLQINPVIIILSTNTRKRGLQFNMYNTYAIQIILNCKT